MPQPTASDVHINQPLTNISIAFLQDQNEFIATKVFPTLPVQKQGDAYFKYDREYWFRTEAKKRGLSQESAGSGYELSTDSYFCDPIAFHKDIDDQVRANADQPLNPDREATEFVTRDLMLRREKDFADSFYTTGIWTGSTTGTDITVSPLWDAADSTPIVDLRTQITSVKKKTGFKPNKLVISDEVWAILQDHPDFLDRITITKDKIVTPALLATVLELEDVLIAGVVENTAAEGAAEAMDFVYGKNALLVYSTPRPGLMTPTGGYTFSWAGFLGAGRDGMRQKRFRMEHLNSDRVEGEMAYDQKLVAADMGAFFNPVIS